jgi:hypothetical protein
MPPFDGIGHTAEWLDGVRHRCPAHAPVLRNLHEEF